MSLPSRSLPPHTRPGGEIVVLGIDPGLRRTGWGLVRCAGSAVSWVAHGVISPDPDLPLARRLGLLVEELQGVLGVHHPDEAAVEETFLANNARSALLLGHARGAALATLSAAGLSVAEYGARHVKKAVVGTGAAEKAQVAFMVRRLLPGAGSVSADAADALAVALTHATERRAPQARMLETGTTRAKGGP
jgi:crossover junction endodeoxyribonuclease RuvC